MTGELLIKCSKCRNDFYIPAGKNIIECPYCDRSYSRSDLPQSQASEISELIGKIDQMREKITDKDTLHEMMSNVINSSLADAIHSIDHSLDAKEQVKTLGLLKYADERREMREFDIAEETYRGLLKIDLENPIYRWKLILCKYNVVFEENKKKRGWFPTCSIKVEGSILKDPDYLKLLELIPPDEREQYERKAAYIDAAQKALPAPKPELTKEEKEEKSRKVKVTAAVIVTILLVSAAAVFLIFVKPGMDYSKAAAQFTIGDYQGARDGYDALGNYKDSLARVVLCDAMIALQEGNAEDTVKMLDQLTADGMEEITGQLADALRPVIAGWRARGLTPQAMLLLLTKADIIDPEGTLHTTALRVEGHTALLDKSVLDSYTADVNEDGQTDLIALNGDYSVTVYRMSGDRNTRMAVSNEILSACALRFGERFSESDENAAVACYAEAYRLLPSEENAAALAAAYRVRAAACETAGDVENALTDAKNAVTLSQSAEDFAYYYDMRLRYCKNGRDTAEAISLWERFAEDDAALLAQFAAQDRWNDDAALLHLAHAAELAAQKDAGCMEELRTAAALGMDVSDAIREAEQQFASGMTRVQLLLLEMELNPKTKEEILVEVGDEISKVASGWKEHGLSPEDVPALIRLADGLEIKLTGMDREAVYREAALAAVGNIRQSAFVDWDQNGYEELLVLNDTGVLTLYGTEETWKALSSYDTGLPDCSFEILLEDEPLLLILAAEENEFQIFTATDNRFRFIFRESDICRYRAEDTLITFSRLLEGSMPRYDDYTYYAAGVDSRPQRTGIDWQQDDYPMPETPEEAVQRYLEALAWDIPEEVALLTAEGSAFSVFTLDRSALPAVLQTPVSATTRAYCKQENAYLFAVDYTAGQQSGRFWATVDNTNGWKVTGLSASYGEDTSADVDAELLCLNEQATGQITKRQEYRIYRLYVPSDGLLRLVWYGAKKNSDDPAYHILIQQGSLSGESLMDTDLNYITGTQLSNPLFLSSGVYYVTIRSLINSAPEYRMTLEYEPMENTEKESNDTPPTAFHVDLNTTYHGSLSSKKDVDYYSFILAEPSAVRVMMETSDTGKETETYRFSVLEGAYNTSVSSPMPIPGNNVLSEIGPLYLSPGMYLVEVRKGDATYSGDVYAMTVHASPVQNAEMENNDTLSAASQILADTVIQASVGKESDIDCFAFTLEHDALVQPIITFRPLNTSSRTFALSLMDDNRNELYKVSINGRESEKTIMPIALAAGQYFFKITNYYFAQQSYTLRVSTETVEAAEREPNNAISQATPLVYNRPYTGLLYTEEDVDYYLLSVPTDRQVTLKFLFSKGESKNTVFVITIETNGKNYISPVYAKENSGGFVSNEFNLSAGEYYVKIRPSTYTSEKYTLEIDWQKKTEGM